MQTRFSEAQLTDPAIRTADSILRACVHCGFCNAACPTYQVTGDELDGPRGRIYLIKDMLEQGRAPGPVEQRHLDRCLSCLSCMSACPSGVDYMHLIDPARTRIEEQGSRSAPDRFIRAALVRVLSDAKLARQMFALGRLTAPLMRVLPGLAHRLARLLSPPADKLAPVSPGLYPAAGLRKKRVILLAGCVQQALAPRINHATIRLLNRLGCDVSVVEGAGCCGSLPHHMGREDPAHDMASATLKGWAAWEEMEGRADAIISNASGCGTTLKDYGHMFRDDPALAELASDVSARTRDLSEFISEIGLPACEPAAPPSVVWQSPCSLQHGQKITIQPIDLLRKAGFSVSIPAEPHMCCGSAGTYNILQGEISDQLRDRKINALTATGAEIIVSANIGCMAQLESVGEMPVIHLAELLDWATGGPAPDRLADSLSGCET